MGVRWTTRKPSEWVRDKKEELHDKTIPQIGKVLAEAAEDEIRSRTPTGVTWVPKGAPKAVPVTTYNLIKSIKREMRGEWVAGHYRWEITTNKEYAPYVEYGTVPHVIRSKNPQKSLAYYVAGDERGAKIVQHPGTRPVYMFTKGIAATRPKVRALAEPIFWTWTNT